MRGWGGTAREEVEETESLLADLDAMGVVARRVKRRYAVLGCANSLLVVDIAKEKPAPKQQESVKEQEGKD